MINLDLSSIRHVQKLYEAGLSSETKDEIRSILHHVMSEDDIEVWLQTNHTYGDFANAVIESALLTCTDDSAVKNVEYVPTKEVHEGAYDAVVGRSHKEMLITRMAYHSRSDSYWTSSIHGVLTSWHPTTLKPMKTINNNNYTKQVKLGDNYHTTNRLLGKPPPNVRINDFAFLKNGAVVATCCIDRYINLYDTGTTTHLRRLVGVSRGEYDVLRAKKAPAKVLGASNHEDPLLLNLDTPPVSMEVVSGADKDTMILGTTHGSIVVYNIPRVFQTSELSPIALLGNHDKAGYITKLKFFAPLGGLLSSSWDGAITLTDIVQQKVLRTFRGGHTKSCETFDVSAELNLLASTGTDRDTCLWNTLVKRELHRLTHPTSIRGVAINPMDNQVITVAEDELVRVWDLRMGHVIQMIETGEKLQFSETTQCLLYDRKAFRVITGSYSLKSWNIRRALNNFPPLYRGHTFVPLLLVSLGSGQIISVDTNCGNIWDVQNGQKLNTFLFLSPIIAACVGGMEKRRLFTMDEDGTLTVWNFRVGQETAKFSFKSLRGGGKDVTSLYYITGFIMVFHMESVVFLKEMDASFNESGSEKVFVMGITLNLPAGRPVSKCYLSAETATMPSRLFVGSSLGQVYVYNVNSGQLLASCDATFEGTRLAQLLEDNLIGKMFNIYTHDCVIVEDLLYLPWLGGCVSVHGNQNIGFWSTAKQSFKLHFLYATNFLPVEGHRCLAQCERSELMGTGDDRGCIHIWSLHDVSFSEPMQRQALQHISSFRAHTTMITSLSFVADSEVVVSMSSGMYIKIHTVSGMYVGYCGQSRQYSLPDETTWKHSTRAPSEEYSAPFQNFLFQEKNFGGLAALRRLRPTHLTQVGPF